MAINDYVRQAQQSSAPHEKRGVMQRLKSITSLVMSDEPKDEGRVSRFYRTVMSATMPAYFPTKYYQT